MKHQLHRKERKEFQGQSQQRTLSCVWIIQRNKWSLFFSYITACNRRSNTHYWEKYNTTHCKLLKKQTKQDFSTTGRRLVSWVVCFGWFKLVGESVLVLVDIGCCLLVLDVVGWCLLVSFDLGWRWRWACWQRHYTCTGQEEQPVPVVILKPQTQKYFTSSQVLWDSNLKPKKYFCSSEIL